MAITTTKAYGSPAITEDCSSELNTMLISIPIDKENYRCQKNQAIVNINSAEKPHSIDFNINQLPIDSHHTFYGLASYYNTLHFLHLSPNGIQPIAANDVVKLNQADWFAIVSRFKVVLFNTPSATLKITDQTFSLSWPSTNTSMALTIAIAPKTNLSAFNPEWGDVRYQHLWGWLSGLSTAVEWSLVQIQRHIVSNWGWAIVVFAVLLKLLLLPVSMMTVHLQRKVSQYQSILAPQLAQITANYDGEEAHQRIMAAYKGLGITPFYTLKPMIGALIQIPILVAIFNALGEMYQLEGAQFIWIKNLAYPDAIAALPFFIPFLGDTVNLLPIIMTVITIVSTIMFQNRYAPPPQVKRQKRNLYLMAVVFLILFYPFPAAMVLYWTLANVLQAIQQQLLN